MTGIGAPDDLAGGGVESSEQAQRPVTRIVVGAPLDLVRAQLATSAGWARTIGSRIRMNRHDGASVRCSVSNRQDQPNGFRLLTPLSTTRSTSGVISLPAARFVTYWRFTAPIPSSAAREGRKIGVIFWGTASLLVVCHPRDRAAARRERPWRHCGRSRRGEAPSCRCRRIGQPERRPYATRRTGGAEQIGVVVALICGLSSPVFLGSPIGGPGRSLGRSGPHPQTRF